MTEEQCKKCEYGFIDELWGPDMEEEIWWWDCDNEKAKATGDDWWKFRDDVDCPFFEKRRW